MFTFPVFSFLSALTQSSADASLSQVSRSHIHRHIHIHIHTFIHTHIHIYTHTYKYTLLIFTYTPTCSHWCLALTGVSISQGTSAAHSHDVSLSQNSAAAHNLFAQGTAAALELVSTSLSVSATCTLASTTNKAPWLLRRHKGLAAVANAAICKREHPPYPSPPIPGRDTSARCRMQDNLWARSKRAP